MLLIRKGPPRRSSKCDLHPRKYVGMGEENSGSTTVICIFPEYRWTRRLPVFDFPQRTEMDRSSPLGGIVVGTALYRIRGSQFDRLRTGAMAHRLRLGEY